MTRPSLFALDQRAGGRDGVSYEEDPAWPLNTFDTICASIISAGFALAFLLIMYSGQSSVMVSVAYTEQNHELFLTTGILGSLAGAYLGFLFVDQTKSLVSAFVGAMVGFLVYFAAAEGLPVVAANFLGSPAKEIVVVVNPDYSSKRCRGIVIQNESYNASTICHFRREFAKGDKLELTGSASYWGFRYDSIMRLR